MAKQPILKQTALTSPEEFSQLSSRHQANVIDCLNLFEPQRRLLRHFLRLAFTIAGLLWFVLWFPELAQLSESDRIAFKQQQYELYLLLLTLWGFDLKRQEKRLAFLLRFSAMKGKRWYELTADDLRASQQMNIFEILWKLPNNPNRRIWHLLLPHGLIIGSIVQLGRQFALLFH